MAQNTSDLFMQASLQKLKNAYRYTLSVAEQMPEDKYGFKPVEAEMNFGAQLLHLSANMGWLCSSYLGGKDNPVTKADAQLTRKTDILAVLKKAYQFAIVTLQQYDPAHLGDSVHFFAGPMTQLQIINLLNDHQTHHRAQMLVYERLNGIKPPDYVGW
ncbi:MAG: DinB family protein [Bacteroidota bacterium]|nr:DinB family protein [Bacteroidota bacterium]